MEVSIVCILQVTVKGCLNKCIIDLSVCVFWLLFVKKIDLSVCAFWLLFCKKNIKFLTLLHQMMDKNILESEINMKNPKTIIFVVVFLSKVNGIHMDPTRSYELLK